MQVKRSRLGQRSLVATLRTRFIPWVGFALLAACGSDDPLLQDDAGALEAGMDGSSLVDGGQSDTSATDGGSPLDDAEVRDPCARCHGSSDNAAPPVSLSGLSDTGLRAVGAHQIHLTDSDWHAQILCTDCHRVPATVDAEGHIDDPLPAEVIGEAGWNGTNCANYCHGATLSGGTATQPEWTKVDGTQATCGSCHALPPTETQKGETHPAAALSACANCHGSVVDAEGQIIDSSLHLNGRIEVTDNGGPTNCTLCHGGTDNATGAPPRAVDGSLSSSIQAVGAHSEHVMPRPTHAAWDCVVCHPAYPNVQAAGHLSDGAGDITFGGLAAGTSYDAGTGSCSNNYCHGNGKSGATGSASWTASISGCNACHPTAQLGGKHKKHAEKDKPCNLCHGTTSSDTQIGDAAKHVNGTVDLSNAHFQWTAATKTCSGINGCHDEAHKDSRW